MSAYGAALAGLFQGVLYLMNVFKLADRSNTNTPSLFSPTPTTTYIWPSHFELVSATICGPPPPQVGFSYAFDPTFYHGHVPNAYGPSSDTLVSVLLFLGWLVAKVAEHFLTEIIFICCCTACLRNDHLQSLINCIESFLAGIFGTGQKTPDGWENVFTERTYRKRRRVLSSARNRERKLWTIVGWYRAALIRAKSNVEQEQNKKEDARNLLLSILESTQADRDQAQSDSGMKSQWISHLSSKLEKTTSEKDQHARLIARLESAHRKNILVTSALYRQVEKYESAASHAKLQAEKEKRMISELGASQSKVRSLESDKEEFQRRITRAMTEIASLRRDQRNQRTIHDFHLTDMQERNHKLIKEGVAKGKTIEALKATIRRLEAEKVEAEELARCSPPNLVDPKHASDDSDDEPNNESCDDFDAKVDLRNGTHNQSASEDRITTISCDDPRTSSFRAPSSANSTPSNHETSLILLGTRPANEAPLDREKDTETSANGLQPEDSDDCYDHKDNWYGENEDDFDAIESLDEWDDNLDIKSVTETLSDEFENDSSVADPITASSPTLSQVSEHENGQSNWVLEATPEDQIVTRALSELDVFGQETSPARQPIPSNRTPSPPPAEPAVVGHKSTDSLVAGDTSSDGGFTAAVLDEGDNMDEDEGVETPDWQDRVGSELELFGPPFARRAGMTVTVSIPPPLPLVESRTLVSRTRIRALFPRPPPLPVEAGTRDPDTVDHRTSYFFRELHGLPYRW